MLLLVGHCLIQRYTHFSLLINKKIVVLAIKADSSEPKQAPIQEKAQKNDVNQNV